MEKLRAFLLAITNIEFRIVKGNNSPQLETYAVEFGEMSVRVRFTIYPETNKIYFHYMDSLLDMSIPNNAILFNDYIALHENLID